MVTGGLLMVAPEALKKFAKDVFTKLSVAMPPEM